MHSYPEILARRDLRRHRLGRSGKTAARTGVQLEAVPPVARHDQRSHLDAERLGKCVICLLQLDFQFACHRRLLLRIQAARFYLVQQLRNTPVDIRKQRGGPFRMVRRIIQDCPGDDLVDT